MTAASPAPRLDTHQRDAIAAHLATLPADAPIRAIVAGAPVAAKLAAFEAENARAIRNQDRYKQLGRTALVLTTLGTLLGAVSLLPLDRWVPNAGPGIIGGVQSLANIVSLALVWWIGRSDCVDRWMTSRARAEQLRGEVFEAILDAPTPEGADGVPLLKQRLGLTLAAHVDHQLAYFRRAIDRHLAAARSLSLARALSYLATGTAILIGLVALAGELVAWGWPLPAWLAARVEALAAPNPVRWQLGLNTIAASLLAYASSRSLMSQDERNASLYRTTVARLDDLKHRRQGEAEIAAAAGSEPPVRAFLAAAQAILAADHMAWYLARPPENPSEAPNDVMRPAH